MLSTRKFALSYLMCSIPIFSVVSVHNSALSNCSAGMACDKQAIN